MFPFCFRGIWYTAAQVIDFAGVENGPPFALRTGSLGRFRHDCCGVNGSRTSTFCVVPNELVSRTSEGEPIAVGRRLLQANYFLEWIYSSVPAILIDKQPRSGQIRSKCTGIAKHYAGHTKFDGRFDVFAPVVDVNRVTRLDSEPIEKNLKNTPVRF